MARLAVLTLPYSTESDAGTAAGPEALLARDEAAAYGAWNRIALAGAHLAALTADAVRAGAFPILLLSNCYGALGALAGLRQCGDPEPPRIGLVWIDAHGDCNTPETTLSGMSSGMPVAIATGLCLERLRRQAGLDVPIAPR